jgi:hypothetical protein
MIGAKRSGGKEISKEFITSLVDDYLCEVISLFFVEGGIEILISLFSKSNKFGVFVQMKPLDLLNAIESLKSKDSDYDLFTVAILFTDYLSDSEFNKMLKLRFNTDHGYSRFRGPLNFFNDYFVLITYQDY